MPATLTALLGVAIHGARRAQVDPTELQRAAAMLVTAAGARRLDWEVQSGGLFLNGIPIASDSPGADLVTDALTSHGAAELRMPAALSAAQWTDLAGILGAASGIYPTPDHVQAAIVGIVPGASFTANEAGITLTEGVEEARHDIPGALSFVEGIDAIDPAVVSTAAERADLSDLLDPLLDEGRAAVADRDYPRLAKALLGLHEIANRGDAAVAAIITRERRRVVPAAAVETMVRLLPRVGVGSPIALSVMRLGREGAEAIADVLATDPPRADRRILLEVMTRIDRAPDVLAAALSSSRTPLVRDAVETLGRMGIAGAVPAIAALLKDADQDVRAAAWHALETIGTPEAMDALRHRR
jgi:hypothetical protein